MKVVPETLGREIVRLIERYPASAWDVLADMLEDSITRAHFVRFLRRIARGTSKEPDRRAFDQSKQPDFDGMDLGQLRGLAKKWGVAVSPRDSRFRLITKLRNREAHSRVSHVVSEPKSSNYDQWFKIIMADSGDRKRR